MSTLSNMRWCRMAHIVGRGMGWASLGLLASDCLFWCVCGGGGEGGCVYLCVYVFCLYIRFLALNKKTRVARRLHLLFLIFFLLDVPLISY